MAERPEKGVLSEIREGVDSRVVLAADVATDLLRRAVIGGKLAPGQLLREATIADELGISRTPVRTALQRLRAEGLVDLSPGRTARVKTFDDRELAEVYDVRAVLESHASYLAATRISGEEIDGLRACCDRFDALVARRGAEDLVGLVEEDLIFHAGVWDASGNRRLASCIRDVAAVPLAYKAYYWSAQNDYRQRSGSGHRAILEAIEAGDAEQARERMREHITTAGAVLLEHFAAR